MHNKFKKILSCFNKVRAMSFAARSACYGYLYEVGWTNSFYSQNAVDMSGNALPWLTYPFIDFIKPRLTKKLVIFEYGSGNGTIFYSKHAGGIEAVEHDKTWYDSIRTNVDSNVELIFEKLDYGGAYSKAALKSNYKYDLIIVDGRDRNNCLMQSIEAIKDNGVIILDDSERIEYSDGVEYLLDRGYRKLDFIGFAPGLLYKKCTSIFYKNDNVLGI